MDAVEKLTKRGRTGKNFYRKKALINSGAARAGGLSMKTQNSGFFSKKDLLHFINTYFSEKTPMPYPRLGILSKLLVCQFALHNRPNQQAIAQPFVFRLSPELNAMSDSHLKKAIQRKLKKTLGETPLYWLTTEYDNQKETSGKHLNGEILLQPGELEKCKQAFKELFGLYCINPDTGKPRISADGTIRQKKGLRFAIDFPTQSRRNEARKHGEFYSVFNWVSYSTKQFTRRKFARTYAKESAKVGEPFYYISAELNKLTAAFYANQIRN